MRPCTLRIASAEGNIKATSLDAALVEHAPWYRTAPAALPIHIKPPEPGWSIVDRPSRFLALPDPHDNPESTN
jgi:hypothetical protein